MVEVRPGVYVPHSLSEFVRLWDGVDREATKAISKPIERETP
jgi:hypothetical protein